jgi:hypothetical protein
VSGFREYVRSQLLTEREAADLAGLSIYTVRHYRLRRAHIGFPEPVIDKVYLKAEVLTWIDSEKPRTQGGIGVPRPWARRR